MDYFLGLEFGKSVVFWVLRVIHVAAVFFWAVKYMLYF